MEAYQTMAPDVEIIPPADRAWAAGLNVEAHDLDSATPAECLVEPGEDPEDPEGWAYWDRFVWEPTEDPADDDLGPWPNDLEIDAYYAAAREGGYPDDFDQCRDGIG